MAPRGDEVEVAEGCVNRVESEDALGIDTPEVASGRLAFDDLELARELERTHAQLRIEAAEAMQGPDALCRRRPFP